MTHREGPLRAAPASGSVAGSSETAYTESASPARRATWMSTSPRAPEVTGAEHPGASPPAPPPGRPTEAPVTESGFLGLAVRMARDQREEARADRHETEKRLTERISETKADLERSDAQTRSDVARGFVEARAARDKGFAEARAEREAMEKRLADRISEAKSDLQRTDAKTRTDMEDGFAEARAEREKGFAEARAEREKGFAEARAEREKGFAEARAEREKGFAEARAERAELREGIQELLRRFDRLEALVMARETRRRKRADWWRRAALIGLGAGLAEATRVIFRWLSR